MAKRYSRAEWARLQARLPEEDRIPWEQSPDMPAGPSAIARGESGTIGAVSAARNMPAASIPAVVSEPLVPTLVPTATQPAPKPTLAPQPTLQNVPQGVDPAIAALLAQLQQQNLAATLAAQAEANRRSAEAQAGRQSAYDLLYQQFSQYGLGALVEPLKGFITSGINPSEFTIRLRESDAYKKRFAANQQRVAKGLRALSEAEYIGLEDQYQDVMRRYGLPASYYQRGEMGRQEGFEKFIAGDVSPVELEDRIQVGQRRVINAAPQIKDALMQYYGGEITNGDILAYVLDPEKAIENIKRKVTAAEIGGAAARFGLGLGRERAERLQQYGIEADVAQRGFEAVAGGLERGRQLSEFYRQGPYTQETMEEEVFSLPGATEASRRRRQLTQLEQASFSGSSGIAQGALARDRAGAI